MARLRIVAIDEYQYLTWADGSGLLLTLIPPPYTARHIAQLCIESSESLQILSGVSSADN